MPIIIMYDPELVVSWKQLKKRKTKLLAEFLFVLLSVGALPAFLQATYDRMTGSAQLCFVIAWIGALFFIIVHLGFYRQSKLNRAMTWTCLSCGKELRHKEIGQMIVYEECPYCTAAFRG